MAEQLLVLPSSTLCIRASLHRSRGQLMQAGNAVAIPTHPDYVAEDPEGGRLTKHSSSSGEKHFTSSQRRRSLWPAVWECRLIYHFSLKEEEAKSQKLWDEKGCDSGPKKTQIFLTHFCDLKDHFKLCCVH